MSRGRLGTMLTTIGTQAVQRITHSEFGHVTARRDGGREAPEDGAGTDANGVKFLMIAVSAVEGADTIKPGD